MKQMSGSNLFMIAVVCGVVAAFSTVYYLKHVEEKYRNANKPIIEEKVAVIVPKRDLMKGDSVTVDAIANLKVPKKYLPSNYIPASQYKKILNRTVVSPVKKGRIMTIEAIRGTKANKFSQTIELGRRAYSLKVNKVDSFDGLLRPGDTIDLFGEFDLKDLGVAGGSEDELSQVIMPVLESVEVLSAGREDYTGRRYERSVQKNSRDGFNMEFTIITLKLSPRQIARVELAESTGSIFAVLRNPKDTSVAKFEYLHADILLEKEQVESIDLVLDENGKPVGRIVGDNVVDADGNIIGKIVNGKAVALDGSALGTIAKNVDPDDPILRVRERADVVRDANGNVIGKVVDGKILDRNGNVIGRVDADGNAVGLNGESLGRIEKNVALDAQGNVVDLGDSSLAVGKAQISEIVRDANGNVIGRVVDGQIIDANGRVVGRVDASGQAVGLDGKTIGTVEKAMLDRDGNVVGTVTEVIRDANGNIVGKVEEVVRDANGNVIGRVVGGKLVDANGKVIGTVNADGSVTDLSGNSLGQVEKVVLDKNGKVVGTVNADGTAVAADGSVLGATDTAVLGSNGEELGKVVEVVRDANGNIVGKVEEVVRDANGNIIGRVVNGKVVDADGNIVGTVNADGSVTGANGEILGQVEKVVVDNNGRIVGKVNADGTAVAADGTVLGSVDTAVLGADGQELGEMTEVVRDASGKIIGRLVDGKVVDANGNVIGVLKDGKVVDLNGKVIAENVSVTTESRATAAAALRDKQERKITREVDYIEFIPGGNDEEGILSLRRIRLQ